MLATVNFWMCDRLTDASVIVLAEHCQQLVDVNFSLCEQLTNASVVALAEHCPLSAGHRHLPCTPRVID